jgi:hypothetical protein
MHETLHTNTNTNPGMATAAQGRDVHAPWASSSYAIEACAFIGSFISTVVNRVMEKSGVQDLYHNRRVKLRLLGGTRQVQAEVHRWVRQCHSDRHPGARYPGNVIPSDFQFISGTMGSIFRDVHIKARDNPEERWISWECSIRICLNPELGIFRPGFALRDVPGPILDQIQCLEAAPSPDERDAIRGNVIEMLEVWLGEAVLPDDEVTIHMDIDMSMQLQNESAFPVTRVTKPRCEPVATRVQCRHCQKTAGMCFFTSEGTQPIQMCCKGTYYCSASCQRADLAVHRRHCYRHRSSTERPLARPRRRRGGTKRRTEGASPGATVPIGDEAGLLPLQTFVEEDGCVVCFDPLVEHEQRVLRCCGSHHALCATCALQLERGGYGCPMCRSPAW